jgi:hypothetical protein
MSMHRVIKKTAYATGFFLFVCLIGFLIISPFLPKKQAQVVLVTPEPLAAILVENIVAIPHIDQQGPKGKTVDVVARLRNNNARAGIGTYPVTFELRDSGDSVIQSVTQNEYVLPGGVSYIAALDMQIPPGSTFDHANVVTQKDPHFTTVPNTAPIPQFSIFPRDRTFVNSGNFVLQQQTGIVTNTSSFDWQVVDVTAVAVDKDGAIIGVGKTTVGKLLVGEQREFTIQWPRPNSATAQVIAIATTDMFNDSNFVNIIGDPNKLR